MFGYGEWIGVVEVLISFMVAMSSFLTIFFALDLMGIIKHCVGCGR